MRMRMRARPFPQALPPAVQRQLELAPGGDSLKEGSEGGCLPLAAAAPAGPAQQQPEAVRVAEAQGGAAAGGGAEGGGMHTAEAEDPGPQERAGSRSSAGSMATPDPATVQQRRHEEGGPGAAS